jgi:hypothetical protein
MKKIDSMHESYGKKEGFTCKECSNLRVYDYHGKKYKKCSFYGITHSEATDWAYSFTACGMHDIAFDEKLNIPIIARRKQRTAGKPIEGQVSIFNDY